VQPWKKLQLCDEDGFGGALVVAGALVVGLLSGVLLGVAGGLDVASALTTLPIGSASGKDCAGWPSRAFSM
jgi:hypothetical protein